MLANAALTAWLVDPEAQARTLDRSVVAHRTWRDLPELRELADRLGQAAGDPDRVAAAAMGVLADDALAHRCVADMMMELDADSFFTPPLRPIPGTVGQGVRLFDHPDLLVSLVTIQVDSLAAKKLRGAAGRTAGRTIAFSGELALRRMIRAGDATVQRFAATAADANFALPRHLPCRIGPFERLSDGDLFIVDGRWESFTFVHALRAIVYLECTVLAGRAPFRAEYDAETLRPLGASSTDLAASRVQLMLSALRGMDEGAAELSLYDRLLDDTDFAVRWHAMRELMQADADSAWPRLRRLADDPHPDIAAAAGHALALYDGGGTPCHG